MTNNTATASVSIAPIDGWEVWKVRNLPAGLTEEELQAEIQSRIDDGTFFDNADLDESGSYGCEITDVGYV